MKLLIVRHDADREIAADIASVLGLRHEVQETDGLSEDLAALVAASHLVVPIVSEALEPSVQHALAESCRTRSLKPGGFVLPVVLSNESLRALPPYFQSVTVVRLPSIGALAAREVRRLLDHAEARRTRVRRGLWGLAAVVAFLVLGREAVQRWDPPLESERGVSRARDRLAEAAATQGFRDVQVISSWIIEPQEQVSVRDFPIAGLVAALKVQSKRQPDGTAAVAMYVKDDAPPTPAFNVMAHPHHALKAPNAPSMFGPMKNLAGTGIESMVMGVPRTLGILAMAPYLGSVSDDDTSWLCSAMPLGPIPPDSSPAPRAITITPRGCPTREFPVPSPPPPGPFPPFPLPEAADSPTDQLRTIMLLPKLASDPHLSTFDQLRVSATRTALSPQRALIAIVWASPEVGHGSTP